MRYLFLYLLLITALYTGCLGPSVSSAGGKKRIVATTGMVADAVQHLVGDLAEVEALMGPGVDPHLYKAAQGDMKKLSGADIIVYNGLHLEGKMVEVLEKISHTRPVFSMGEGISAVRLLPAADAGSFYDPHIWFDVVLWADAVQELAGRFMEVFPADTALIRQNARIYRDSLLQLDRFVREEIAGIPASGRVLITSHDAFRYFGRAYHIEVKGLQGISTVSEYGLQDVSAMVNYIVQRRIKAVFVESSVSEKSLQAVIEGCKAKGHPVRIGGTLFSDAMGLAGTPEGSYTGMVRHNVNAIVNALR